jgi:hypothetical protein
MLREYLGGMARTARASVVGPGAADGGAFGPGGRLAPPGTAKPKGGGDMKALLWVVAALGLALPILNILGGIVSCIWLAILGEWGAVGLGIILFLLSILILRFAPMPSDLFRAPAAYCLERGKTFGLLWLCAFSNLYVLACVTVWCCAILFLFVNDATASTLIPQLVWSYGVAGGALLYMAAKDRGPEGLIGAATTLTTLFAELAYVVVMLLFILTNIALLQAMMIFGAFMIVAFVVKTSYAFILYKQQKEVAQQEDELMQ